jgi:hypothetical protein
VVSLRERTAIHESGHVLAVSAGRDAL